jgi:hypothetical protein
LAVTGIPFIRLCRGLALRYVACGATTAWAKACRGSLGQVVPDAREHPDRCPWPASVSAGGRCLDTADGDALPGHVRGEGVDDLAGAEHDAGRSSFMSRSSLTPSSRAVGDGGTAMPAAHAI